MGINKHPIRLDLFMFNVIQVIPNAVEVIKIKRPITPENEIIIIVKNISISKDSLTYEILFIILEKYLAIKIDIINDIIPDKITAVIIIKMFRFEIFGSNSFIATADPVRAFFIR